MIFFTLLAKTCQRPETRGIAFTLFQKAGPCAGQLQHAYRVPGRRGIKNDVIVIVQHLRIGQQPGEFIKCGDFCGAGTGQLFLHRFDHHLGQGAARRCDDAVTVQLCCRLRINFQCKQIGNRLHRSDAVTDADAEYLTNIRCRVGADQQHASPLIGKPDGGGAGDRGFADAAFTGEE